MTNENKKTSNQLIFPHIFRNKQFKDNLENFMSVGGSESPNATSTPLIHNEYVMKFKLCLLFKIQKTDIS
jgi:hypothetical protein